MTMTVGGSSNNGTSSTTPSGTIDDDDKCGWLGSEPHLLLTVEEERQKLADLLSRLTVTDRAEIARVDTSIPIRHLRADKVSLNECVLVSE
jgi:sulfur carrier protein ThiS